MKELLIATFLVMFSTSLQKESPGDVSPAEIFIANSEVKEGQEVRFKCKVTDVRTRRVYVHVCRSGTTVKTAELEESKNDIMFVFDKVTVKDSGLYTCVYSVEKDAACKMSRTGRNSASLEVYGEILPAKITGTQSSLREGEDLTLTCSITGHQSCSEVYVYLCLNGIVNSIRTVNCGINSTTTTFLLNNVKPQQSGHYSCVYSTYNYSLIEVRKTGENSIYVEVHDHQFSNLQWQVNFTRLLISVGVIIFACIIVIFDIMTTGLIFGQAPVT